MLERLFHREYRVLTATSGEQGLQMLGQEEVSLIISDQRMPGMTGTEMLKASIRTNPDAVKIILTGYTDVEALIEAINCARVYRYVNKPWDPEKLKAIVSSAIRERETMIEQRRLLDGLVALVQQHPWAFIPNAASSSEEMVDEHVQ